MARKPTLGTRYSRIRTTIKKTLEVLKNYDPSDEIVIDELLFNLKIADDAKEDIKERGVQINVVKDPKKTPYYQPNPSITIYNSAVKNIGTLLSKLGITAQERIKSNIDDGDDPLGDLFKNTPGYEKTAVRKTLKI